MVFNGICVHVQADICDVSFFFWSMPPESERAKPILYMYDI